MSNDFCVYIHKNKSNGKLYCGITSQNPENRWREGNGYPHNQHFKNAISKYGWDGFEHLIIHTDLSRDEACRLEQKYISTFDLTNPCFGYNQTRGGDGTLGYNHTKETKAKMSQNRMGHICTDETKQKISTQNSGLGNGMYGMTPWNKGMTTPDDVRLKISQSRKGKTAGVSHPMYGKRHADASIKKMSESHKGCTPWNKGRSTGIRPPNTQRVGMYDDTGTLLKVYTSISDAIKDVGGYSANISACCRGRVQHASGYVWKYLA